MRGPWLVDGGIVKPSRVTPMDFAIIGLAYLEQVGDSSVYALRNVRLALMGHYNDNVALEDMLDALNDRFAEEDADG